MNDAGWLITAREWQPARRPAGRFQRPYCRSGISRPCRSAVTPSSTIFHVTTLYVGVEKYSLSRLVQFQLKYQHSCVITSAIITCTDLTSWITRITRVKGKGNVFPYYLYRALGPELISVYRQSARRWLSHPPGDRLPLLSARPAVTLRIACSRWRHTVALIRFQLTTHLSPKKDDRLSWPGWLTCSWPVPTIVVTHQLQVERRIGKVRRPETTVPRNQLTIQCSWAKYCILYSYCRLPDEREKFNHYRMIDITGVVLTTIFLKQCGCFCF